MIMWKLRAKKGFTLVEALVVVAIIGILGTVIVLSVVDYLRSTTKLEYDGYAKSIFVAAQNHLTMAEHEGYLGRKYFGVNESSDKGIYRFVLQKGVDEDLKKNTEYKEEDSVFDLILPYGSVDETVRSGSYIIRYQKEPAQVLDVFFWSEDGRYAYSYTANDYTNNLFPNRSDGDALRNYGDGAIIGYYGGLDANAARGEKLNAPKLQLFNEDRLYVLVDDPNGGTTGAKLKLTVRGLSSGKVKEFMLSKSETENYWDDSIGQFRVVLDDVTEINSHFFSVCDELIPGENIKVEAVAYNDSVFTNVAFSAAQTTNSLFGDVTLSDDPDESSGLESSGLKSVGITSIRHLENLDPNISNLMMTIDTADDGLSVTQTSDLNWNEFTRTINSSEPDSVCVYNIYSEYGSNETGCFEPISPNYPLSYDGKNHIIRDLKINAKTYGGLFGAPTSTVSVSNLRMEDCAVSGHIAGTLAGSLEGGMVTNVLVCQSKDADAAVGVEATAGYAGGLIGEVYGTTVEGSATAVYVSCSSDNSDHGAGGLVGSANEALILGSYSAGFTVAGAYDDAETSFTVHADAGSAGGLIGDALNTTVNYCYSTCSAYGKLAGGLVGTFEGSIQDSYCTGLVMTPVFEGEGANPYVRGAFAGKLTGDGASYTNNHYFSIISGGSAVSNGVYGGIVAFDATTASYQAFVSGKSEAQPASPYDDTLVAYYQGKYNLRTVAQLGYEVSTESYSVDSEEGDTVTVEQYVSRHYGDWPAPEIMVINTKTGEEP